jgi:hypothetical protein
VLRDFLADARQFPPKDEAGLNVVSTHVLGVDALSPTYSILNLTRADALTERETRLRVLKAADDLEFGVFRGAGVDVIQTPETWMMVYVGPEVGYAALIAATQDDIEAKTANRREFLAGEGKKLIAERRLSVDDPVCKFGAALYFFQ